MDCFDQIPRPLGLDFDAYVDDLSFSCTGAARYVLRALVEGSRALHEGSMTVLRWKLAMDKTGMASSSKDVASQLVQKLSPLAGSEGYVGGAASLGGGLRCWQIFARAWHRPRG
eukprot:4969195-Pyramimonas_sp.AAC.1